MTVPPFGFPETGLWMTIEDVFHIKGRGTVVTGLLQGSGQLNVGDALVCDGGRWQVTGIEQFRAVLTSALPGANIGVLLRDGPSGQMLRGVTAHFEPGSSAGPGYQFPGIAPRKRRWRG